MRKETNGAVVTILGTTRNNFEGKRVLTLEYEAFEEMALKKMEEIRKELQDQFHIEDIAISHRIGTVSIGPNQSRGGCGFASPQRSIPACHQAVDRIKEIVPIWKKEVFDDAHAGLPAKTINFLRLRRLRPTSHEG